MKITTNDLKNKISTWLDTPLVKEAQFSDDPKEYSDQGEIDREAGFFGLKPGISASKLNEYKFNLFKDGSQWKRVEKRKIGEDVYFGICWFAEDVSKFYGDHEEMQGYNMELAQKLHEEKKLEKCWMRMFIPKNELADNYRLEVLTDPDDTKIVAWQVITD